MYFNASVVSMQI